MDLDPFAQEVARLAALPGAEEHAQAPCRGAMGGCTWCIALYRAAVGDERPTCLVCSGQHFLYEPHWAPGSTEAVQLGVTFANAMPARWDTEMPVLIRLLSGCADCGLPITGAGDERHNHCGPLPHTGPVGGPYCDRCR